MPTAKEYPDMTAKTGEGSESTCGSKFYCHQSTGSVSNALRVFTSVSEFQRPLDFFNIGEHLKSKKITLYGEQGV